ncbi:MAG: SU10 major capsid protein, partial [Pyrinomonadaceae bacterium]
RREALELHSIEMERAFLWGNKKEDLAFASQPTRTTGGLKEFVATNVTDFGGVVSIDDWEDALQDVFKDGSAEKLALVGNRALNTLNKIARNNYTVETTPVEKTYGMAMVTWTTPYGTLQIKQHPLLSRDPGFSGSGFIIDPAKVKYRYLRGRDTQYRENVQNPGDDAVKNEFLSECGLEVNHESAHAYFEGADAFAA